MKSLYKFTQERIEQMDGKQLDAINDSSINYESFYEKIADKIIDSTAFQEWAVGAIGHVNDTELGNHLIYLMKRVIFHNIKDGFADIIEDKIYDYHDFQDLREDKHSYYGVSEKNIVGV